MKYYAVQKGRNPGVYASWDECKAQVDGVSGAVYKSFKSKEEAEAFLEKDGYDPNLKKQAAKEEAERFSLEKYSGPIAFVDGSFNSETNTAGYGVVIIPDPFLEGEQIHLSGRCEGGEDARNVVGEVTAAKAAVSYAVEKGYNSLIILHDYEGIGKWARGEWKANSEVAKEYRRYLQSKACEIAIGFDHVRGHIGVRGNELADILARMGSGVAITREEELSVHPEPLWEPDLSVSEFDEKEM